MKGNHFLVLIVVAALIAGCGKSQTTPIPASEALDATMTETPVQVTATPSPTTMPPTTAAVTPTTEPGHYPPPSSPEPGEAYRFENLARTEFAGVTYKLDRMLIARREVLPPEYYAYSPLLVGKETILYLKLVVTNSNQMQIYASPAGMLVLGDGEKTLDAFRLQDYIEAGASLPYPQDQGILNGGRQYTVGYWLGTDVPPEAITSLKLVLSCPTPGVTPNCLGMEVGLRNVILEAALPESQQQPLAQAGDYSQALARSDLGNILEISDGLTVELLRLFTAPREAVPEIADLLPADTQTVLQIAYRFTNTANKPLELHFLYATGFYWHFVPPDQQNHLSLKDFYKSGLSFGKTLAGFGDMLEFQPGETVISGVWFGLPTPVSQLGGSLLLFGGVCITPAGVEAGPQTCPEERTYNGPGQGAIWIDTASPRVYQPFPEIQEPAVAGPALPENRVCQNEAQLQSALQAAIPQDQWGLKYQTNGENPPEMKFIGVTSGQVSKLTASGRGLFAQETLDLARLYFLSADGTLNSLWTAPGMTSTMALPDSPSSDSTYTSFGDPAWYLSEQAQSAFSQPGNVYDVVISDWYVKPDGVHWDRCYQDSRNTLPFVCDLGLLLDKDGSAQFFSTGIPPANSNYLAYGWDIYPNSDIARVTLPAGCP